MNKKTKAMKLLHMGNDIEQASQPRQARRKKNHDIETATSHSVRYYTCHDDSDTDSDSTGSFSCEEIGNSWTSFDRAFANLQV